MRLLYVLLYSLLFNVSLLYSWSTEVVTTGNTYEHDSTAVGCSNDLQSFKDANPEWEYIDYHCSDIVKDKCSVIDGSLLLSGCQQSRNQDFSECDEDNDFTYVSAVRETCNYKCNVLDGLNVLQIYSTDETSFDACEKEKVSLDGYDFGIEASTFPICVGCLDDKNIWRGALVITDQVVCGEGLDLFTGTYNSVHNSNSVEFQYCGTPEVSCADDQIKDQNNTCVDIDSLHTDNFPDANATGGFETTGTIPTDEESCNNSLTLTSSTGYVEAVGWDYESDSCIATAFKCDNGKTYNQVEKICEFPPDTTSFGDNTCVNDEWGQVYKHDFCGDCEGSIGVWNPPVGHEESGMECNKAYIEYNCVKDYRLKKYIEISCGDPLPEDTVTNDMNITSMEDSYLPDQNITTIEDLNTTGANLTTIETLNKINDSLKDINSTLGNFSLDLNMTQNKIIDILSDILGVLDENETIMTSTDSNTTEDTNTTEDSNGTGWSEDSLKDNIMAEFNKKRSIVSEECGLPVFDPSITFMDMVTIENPLPVMHEHTEPYFDQVKLLVILSATLLGILMIFRR